MRLLFVSFAIFCRRDALFVFEHLAKIRRGIEAALHGDLGEVPLSVLDHTARLADLDGVQVRDQRNAQILIEDAAQVVLRDIEMLGDLLNIRELIVVFVDILDDLRQKMFNGVGIPVEFLAKGDTHDEGSTDKRLD